MKRPHVSVGKRLPLLRGEGVNSASRRPFRWVFILIAGSYGATVFLRSILIFQHTPQLPVILLVLVAWSLLLVSEAVISRKWPGYFPVYLVLQTGLTFLLLATPGPADFFAIPFAILSIQVVLRLNLRIWIAWIAVSALGTMMLLRETYENEIYALVLLYTAGNLLYGFFAHAARRAEAVGAQNLALAQELQEANQRLESYANQMEQLVVARERNRLARDLHDSVTQTVFSMTLATQSAALLLERDPPKAEFQLDRLAQLARNALSEMQLLISQLRPEETPRKGLAASLSNYLKSGYFPENLHIDLRVESDQCLEPAEEDGLFRIVQEALNNIVKHAKTDKAQIQLHLTEPIWIEVADQGQGFDLRRTGRGGGVGLFSMHERAEEIGWNLEIRTSPGTGTCIRIEKLPKEVKQI